jgi:hypothetical protein
MALVRNALSVVVNQLQRHTITAELVVNNHKVVISKKGN